MSPPENTTSDDHVKIPTTLFFKPSCEDGFVHHSLWHNDPHHGRRGDRGSLYIGQPPPLWCRRWSLGGEFTVVRVGSKHCFDQRNLAQVIVAMLGQSV